MTIDPRRLRFFAFEFVSRQLLGVAGCILLMLMALPIPKANAALDADVRTALVVGNAGYSFGPLANPINDARALAGSLRELGFEVTVLEDANLAELQGALDDLAQTFKEGGIGLFYYAGHAVQMRGINYLLPTDFTMDQAQDTAAQSISINEIIAALEKSGVGLKLVILDACRDYPFSDINEAFGQGLTSVAAAGEALIAYATTAGQVAFDGQGPNSPYTSALISALELPGQGLYDVFRIVRSKVMQATRGRQLPWISGSIGTHIVLRESEAPVQLASAEITLPSVLWSTVGNSVDPADFENFLLSHPDSPYARSAAERLEMLRAEDRPTIGKVEALTRTLIGPGEQTVAVTECDIWASDPGDPQRLADGVAWGLVNTRQAIRACSEALAADPESPRLNFLLGRALDIAERFKEADVVYRRALAAEYPAAYKNLGYMYRTARGRPPDFKTAAEYYLDAALRGSNAARTALAKLYELGYGVPESPADGVYWARLAATDGYAPAMDHLGNAYRMGLGVDVDYAEAARYYSTAAALDYSNAMSNLGHMYREGKGVSQDIGEAVNWYRRATEAGNPFAPLHLGRLLRKGEQVPRDPAQALSFSELAAERGNEWAYWQIAEMHRWGDLGEPDLAKAYFNLLIARAAGGERRNKSSEELVKLADDRLNEVRELLDPATTREIERKANDWIAQNGLFQFTVISQY